MLTLVTLTAGGLICMAALNVRQSMIATLDRLFAARNFDLAVSFNGMYPFDDVARILSKTPSVVRAEGWIATEAEIPGANEAPVQATQQGGGHRRGGGGAHDGGGGVASDRFAVLAIPAQTPFLTPDIVEGRNLLAAPGLLRRHRRAPRDGQHTAHRPREERSGIDREGEGSNRA